MKTSYRVRSEIETLTLLNQYRKLAGITRLADITHLDYTKLPVFTAIRPAAKSLSTSQGKGLSINAAKCSALMEAIEVYFAENLSPDLINKSPTDLNADPIPYISPNDLNNQISYTNNKEKMNWVYTISALTGQSILAPFPEFSLNSYLQEVLIYAPNTTGLAGGNTYKEALLHSLLEVIEREPSVAKKQVKQIPNKLLNPINKFFEYQIIYKLNRFDIPSFEVLLKSKNPFENPIIFKGDGCHLNKKIALNRAISEAIQSRVTLIAGSRDDILNSKYEIHTGEWESNKESCSYMTIPEYWNTGIDQGTHSILEKISKYKQDVIVLKYHEEKICILKSKIIAKDSIIYA